jgi:meso-butanediol dehydrogenase / (S,S)-butanediol dehydrogenase / diacetyl reductase
LGAARKGRWWTETSKIIFADPIISAATCAQHRDHVMERSVKRFEGKVAIVTGAGSGIGQATATRLVEEGASVVFVGRTEAKLVKAALGFGLTRCLTHTVDLTDDGAPRGVVDAAIERFGRVDILVNNAGIAGVGPFLQKSDAEWDGVMRANLDTVFHMTRAVLPHLQETKGSIVNVTSISGNKGEAGNCFYGATKAAVNNMTQCLALEFGPSGVRVNAVSPGLTRTAMTEPLFAPDTPYTAIGKDAVARIPCGREGRPEEIAAAILFLASDEASFINGVNLPVDGGMSASNGNVRWGV